MLGVSFAQCDPCMIWWLYFSDAKTMHAWPAGPGYWGSWWHPPTSSKVSQWYIVQRVLELNQLRFCMGSTGQLAVRPAQTQSPAKTVHHLTNYTFCLSLLNSVAYSYTFVASAIRSLKNSKYNLIQFINCLSEWFNVVACMWCRHVF